MHKQSSRHLRTVTTAVHDGVSLHGNKGGPISRCRVSWHVLAVLVLAAACTSASTGPSPVVGALVARESLSAVDGRPLPCCNQQLDGTSMSVIGGELRFYRYVAYPDSAATPAGIMPVACVQEVPNLARVDGFTGVVTLPDSTSYLQPTCLPGFYTLLVVRRLGTSADTTIETISSGTFVSSHDTLTLTGGAPVTARMINAAITVSTGGHNYAFVPVRYR